MKIFDKIFKPESAEVDWDAVVSMPEFAKLKDCQQNPKWHGEGTAFDHTVRCVEAAYEHLVEFGYVGTYAKRIAITMILFHDIGKGVTTEFKNGAWHAYSHEFEGEKITRWLLWDEDQYQRERICSAVRYHMEPLRIADATYDLVKKVLTPTFSMFFRWRDVLFVKLCDVLGSVPADKKETEVGIEKIKFLTGLAKTLGAFDTPIHSDRLYEATVLGERRPWVGGGERQNVYVMVGLPGSGKNYTIDKLAGTNFDGAVEVISRDDIRAELGFCNEGDKVVLPKDKEDQVSNVFDSRFIDALRHGKDVILNNINLKRQYRDNYKRLCVDNGFRNINWVYVYVEAPSLSVLLGRRPTISEGIYERMVKGFDFPRPGEYNTFLNFKQLPDKIEW